ncbi:uncharacterized protein BCR38DRAFT_338930 [Pseudomassariella vexata]|uniref:Zn(2)-C6 fungal-type domain-containing protein n=1 Tax=Pseudomassariella vexata TaxID=1141098 RepID=A0A1Y2E3W2_9PEZI|nr:uncharacterized protein BCR38DRAFT_338930 [Pseudomassariella vexata]ORY66248.1 hypothetical protein BCR38DRAFT_338930 [Pseudomassariella vexata]
MSPSNPTEQNGVAPKHRACDECRSRKLACTKESDGCARCKREGIACHYSPQKQMGRPRKRPREESNDNDAAASAELANKTPMINIPPDTPDPGMAFLSFVAGGELGLDHDLRLDQPMPMGSGSDDTQAGKVDWQFGYTGNDFEALNFDNGAVDHAPAFSSTNLDPALFTVATTPDALPNLSSAGSSSSAETAGSPDSTNQKCACTASLYLAIDLMQKLSSDVTEGVRQARLAAKTAYEVVNCPACALAAGPATPTFHITAAAMQNFQNLMLLATLIPSIAHAYERILTLVDKETVSAQADRREIPFKLDGYGGMWGAFNNGPCAVSGILNHRLMEPTLWRRTVRSLLRIDVYGMSSCDASGSLTGSASTPDPFHLGLKDIVIQMENRSKARHALLDAMILSGAWQEPNCTLKLHKTGETPTCQRIIAIARTAIDNLVIP